MHGMMRAINSGTKCYKSPSYEKMRTTLLAQESALMKRCLEPIQSSWRNSEVAIVSDGWIDITYTCH